MNLDSLLAGVSTETTAAIFSAWLVWSLKGTFLLGLAWLATRALPLRSAAVRHVVWASALVGMLVLPVLSVAVPRIPVGWLSFDAPRFSMSTGRPAIASSVEREIPVFRMSSAPVPGDDHASATEQGTTHTSIKELESSAAAFPRFRARSDVMLAIAWLLGVAVLFLRALAGAWQLALWARRSSMVDDAAWLALSQRLAHRMQIRRPVTLLRSERACVPMTWGIVYPIVLLPSDADTWTSDRRTIVLLHELAHIKRFDTLTQFLAQLSTAVCWFNPAVWYAAAQMRREREHACDDVVLDSGARASDYAHGLLQIARPLVSGGAPAAAALAMARRSELEGRLLAILDPRINRRPVSRARLAASSLTIVGLAIPLAALSPAKRGSTDTPASVAETTPPLPSSASTARPPATSAPTFLRAPATAVNPSSAAKLDTVLRAIATTPVGPVTAMSMRQEPLVARPSYLSTRPPFLARRAAKPTPDRETLIAVAQAAAKLSSDQEKAELLLTIAKYYVSDDELRTAYLAAVASMTSDYHQSRALEPVLLKDVFPASAIPQLVRIATRMTSDNDKSRLIIKVATVHPNMTASMRTALIGATASMSSDFGRERSIVAIARRGALSTSDAIGLINVAKAMSSSYSKANALLSIAAHHAMDDRDVRRAYLAAAETISSASDYRRAIVRVLE